MARSIHRRLARLGARTRHRRKSARSIDVRHPLAVLGSTAEAVLAAVVAASVGLVGFVVTVSVLIVQMATGTFSARYMRIFYRDRAFKAVLAVLIGSVHLLVHAACGTSRPTACRTSASRWRERFSGSGILLFVIFLDRAIHRLRPVAVAALVAKAGRRALHEVLEAAARPDAPAVVPAPYQPPGEPVLVVRMSAAERSRRSTWTGSGSGRTRTRASSSFAIRSATSSRQARR